MNIRSRFSLTISIILAKVSFVYFWFRTERFYEQDKSIHFAKPYTWAVQRRVDQWEARLRLLIMVYAVATWRRDASFTCWCVFWFLDPQSTSWLRRIRTPTKFCLAPMGLDLYRHTIPPLCHNLLHHRSNHHNKCLFWPLIFTVHLAYKLWLIQDLI